MIDVPMNDRPSRREAGVLVPLFSCPTTTSWGIGDIGDLVPMAAWLAKAGQRALQLLPINEMAPGQHSPYSAISAMAIDPIFIRVSDVPEFKALGGESALGAADCAELDRVRRAPRIDYTAVRRLKSDWLRITFDLYVDREWKRETRRARSLKRFISEQAWWIEEYALFRAIHAHEGERPWLDWPADLQHCKPAAIDQARRDLARDVLFQQYLQWIAARQWQKARARAKGVTVLGDLPFMVDGDSADVWARQSCFRLDASLGVPPDAFSATGQDWGMPVYRWGQMALEDFRWLRNRARRTADLYDGYRVDHLVGFYRTYALPKDGGAPFFTPSDEAEQTALGESTLGIFRETGASVIAEDLGVVPDFVRESLARLGVPGFRVFRWEREWHKDGQPFREPPEYPALSVAASGTHDTETLVVWWEHTTESERRQIDELSAIQRLTGGAGLAGASSARVCDVLLEALFASGSNLLLLPVQDAFAWRDRINEPGTVTDENWTFRLPWPIDAMDDVPEARERQAKLRDWAERYGR